MNRRAIVAPVLMIAAISAASAQNAPSYAGKWGVEGPDACRHGVRTDDLKVTFTPTELEYYASACRVTSSRRLSRSGDQAYRLKLRCEGEGQKFNKEVILVVLEKTEQRPELLLHIDTADWSALSYQRCSE